MTILRSSALSHVVAGILLAVLAVAGLGRGLDAASDRTPAFGIPGVAVPICHTGTGHQGSDPADQANHACCDACALSALVTLSDGPALTVLTSIEHVLAHGQAMGWVPTLARPRTPRQSQGPPFA